MQLKVVEVYFKEPKMVPVQGGGFWLEKPYAPVEAGITVNVDGELLQIKSQLTTEMARQVPYEQVMGALRKGIMQQIEKRLFNDFNVRK